MIEIDIARLRALGLTPALASLALAAPVADDRPCRLMRLTEVHRESVRLHDGHLLHAARATPRLVRELEDDANALAVGDWVLAAEDAPDSFSVRALLPRQTHITRRDADGHRHAVASNVDTALLVMGLDDDFNPRRLERYLALVQGSGVLAVVVLTKRDVVDADTLESHCAVLRGRLAASTDLLAVDATAADAAQVLAPYATLGQTLVLLGSSGAGKSTLTNTLLGVAMQDTGAVREHDSRGKHTTTARSLHCLPGGACVIDTPGLRALRPDIDEATLAATFADIDSLAGHCRFRDCRHVDEPGCAVRESVPADRLRNYHKLLREARRDTQTVLERQQQVAQWKARGRASKVRLRIKRGEA